MKKLIIGVFALASILSVNLYSAPSAHAAIAEGWCEAFGGEVVTDPLNKRYCSGGAFNGEDIQG